VVRRKGLIELDT